MGIEHLDAVWEHSCQSGSILLILLAVARHSDHKGESVIDQATLQRRTRLSNRRVRHILTGLVAAGELAVVSHHGRGKLSTYRLLVGQETGCRVPLFQPEKRKPTATFPARNRMQSASFREKPETGDQFSSQKPAAGDQFSAPFPPAPPETVKQSAPFSPRTCSRVHPFWKWSAPFPFQKAK